MTDEPRSVPAAADRDQRLDRALDRLIAAEPAPALPPDLARRILAATARIPQEPAPRSAPLARPWFQRPRAVAAAFALVAAVGFAAGWAEPLLIGDAQAVDVAAFVLGSDLEIDL